MKNALLSFKTSTFELKKMRCLAVTAILVSMSIILGFLAFSTFTIRISFAYFPLAIIAYFYGPAVSVYAATAIDLINFMFNPMNGFNPGLTLCAIITGMIYGLFLYQKKIVWTRIVVTFLTNSLICNLLLKSYFLAIYNGISWPAMMITRLPVQIIMLVLEASLFITIFPKIKLLKNKL